MIKLTEKEKKKIIRADYSYHHVRKYSLKNGTYYVKHCYENEAIRELIGEKLFSMVGIKCPEYLYLIEHKKLISKDLHSLSKFMYMEEVPNIKEDLYWRCITLDIVREAAINEVRNKEEILLQINIMHFMDILFSNIDRHLGNYGIFFDKNRNGYLAVFDNGLLIDNLDCVTKPLSKTGIKGFNPKGQECEYFLENLPLEHKKIIYEIFLKFTPNVLEKIIDDIENEYNYKFKLSKKILREYKKNYIMIYLIINKSIQNEIKKEVSQEMKLNKSK